MNATALKRLTRTLSLALLVTLPAQALTLSPIPAKTLSFAAGRDLQPISFSPDGTKLLTIDAAGLTLWQVSPLKPLWRSKTLPKWYAANTLWQSNQVTLMDTQGQQLSLDIRSGKELGRSQRQLPAAVAAALGVPETAKLRLLNQGVWQDDPKQPLPFEVMGGPLLGFYAQHGGQLALKRPGYAPLELWADGKVQRRLDTVYPALGNRGTDTRFTENLAFSPDGRWLAWSAGRRVTVWDAASGQKLEVLRPAPYGQESDELQLVWAADSQFLNVYSMRAAWRYQAPAHTGSQGAHFAPLGSAPVPQGALIRTVSSTGTAASGTGSALLLTQPTANQATQTVGPVPQQVFFSEDGQTTLALAWPTVWVFGPGHKAQGALTLQLPDYAEAAWLTLKGQQLTVYGRNLSWTPGTQPEMTASIWTANLAGLRSGQTIPLTTRKEDKRPNCGASGAGQWLSAVLEPARLCQENGQLSAYQGERQLWSMNLESGASLSPTPDGRWVSVQTKDLWRIYRSDTGHLAGAIRLPKLPKNIYWSPTLRVDGAGQHAALQAGPLWYLADLRSGTIEPLPEVKNARDITFVGKRLAATDTDQIHWFELK